MVVSQGIGTQQKNLFPSFLIIFHPSFMVHWWVLVQTSVWPSGTQAELEPHMEAAGCKPPRIGELFRVWFFPFLGLRTHLIPRHHKFHCLYWDGPVQTWSMDLFVQSFPLCSQNVPTKFPKCSPSSQCVPPRHSQQHLIFYPILFGHISTSIYVSCKRAGGEVGEFHHIWIWQHFYNQLFWSIQICSNISFLKAKFHQIST